MIPKEILNDRNYRRICLAAIVLCVFLYFFFSVSISQRSDLHNLSRLKLGYFVNTTGCHIMALNPMPLGALWYLRQTKRAECERIELLRAETVNGENYLTLTISEMEVLSTYNVECISDIQCIYWTLERINDYWLNSKVVKRFHLSSEVRVEDGFQLMRIECFGLKNVSIYHDVQFFMPPPDPNLNDTLTSSSESSKAKKISVMVLGIDSISHMHYLRMMPLIGSLVEKLPHVEFWGYNRIGRNTYPNIVAMLSGQTASELESGCYQSLTNFDECNFLWNDFKAAGYNTSFAEDSPIYGIFLNGKPGFLKQPTDYDFRPIIVAINAYTKYSVDRLEEVHCSGNRTYADALHEYLYKLIPHIQGKPSFSFFWQSEGVHDYFNYAQILDKSYQNMLAHLQSESILEETFVLLMSNHGMRYGSYCKTHQGILEDSLPLLIALYPKWLEAAYPLAISNLKANAHSLVTVFDLHITLKDLRNLELLSDSQVLKRTVELQNLGTNIPRGISLFLPIPDIRTCESAGIPSSFCVCHTLRQISSTNPKSQRAAVFVVKYINMLIMNNKRCTPLRLKYIQTAYILDRNDTEIFDVKVRLKTAPGEGVFEGTVRILENLLALNGPIVRINLYGNQSNCVNDYKIKMYCYCRK